MTKTSDFKWVALKLVGIISIIFVLQIIVPQITDHFKLIASNILTQPWILITAILLHGSLSHLLLNMFGLALFGSILEKIVGWKKFLIIFFVSGIIANIGSAFLYPSSLGASGAIFGVIGALAVARPTMVVWVLGVPAPMVIAALIWAIQDIVGLFVPSNIANLAHLIGLGVGIILGISHYEKKIKNKSPKIIASSEIDRWEKTYMRK